MSRRVLATIKAWYSPFYSLRETSHLNTWLFIKIHILLTEKLSKSVENHKLAVLKKVKTVRSSLHPDPHQKVM